MFNRLFKRFLFLSSIIVIIPLASCDTPIVVPQSVCDYGTMICNTLNALCTNQSNSIGSLKSVDPLLKYLKEVNDSLQSYVK
jgi:hypothetical protein